MLQKLLGIGWDGLCRHEETLLDFAPLSLLEPLGPCSTQQLFYSLCHSPSCPWCPLHQEQLYKNVSSSLPSLHNSWQKKEELQNIVPPLHMVLSKYFLPPEKSLNTLAQVNKAGQALNAKKLSQIIREQLRFTSLLLGFFNCLDPCKVEVVLFEVTEEIGVTCTRIFLLAKSWKRFKSLELVLGTKNLSGVWTTN